VGKLYSQALIIDDDVDLCNLLRELLSKTIPKVACMHTIESGRTFLNENKPDVIFLDNNLPDGRGVELIAEIRSIATNSFVIVISAMESTKAEASKWGADAILEKPLTISNVIKVLEAESI